MAELGGSQISALLESVPGIAKVLRSPVADALVAMIRAGAGIGEFHLADVDELMQYSVRRGLISADEAEQLMAEVRATGRGRSKAKSGGRKKATAKKGPARKKTAKKTTTKKAAKKTTAKKAKKKPSAKAAKKKTAKKTPKKRKASKRR